MKTFVVRWMVVVAAEDALQAVDLAIEDMQNLAGAHVFEVMDETNGKITTVSIES